MEAFERLLNGWERYIFPFGIAPKFEELIISLKPDASR